MSERTKELEPIKLQPARPTTQAIRAADEILRRYAGDAWHLYIDDAARIIDEKVDLKKLIGEYNDLVQNYEDEHELRLRVQTDLRLLKEKLATLPQQMVKILRQV